MCQENEKINNGQEEKKTAPPKDDFVETQHSITINGQIIEYTARAGTIVLKEEDKEKGEKAKASIFFTSYTKNDVDDPASRPITFAFNGGPGSSSVWLHMGLFGPKRVLMDDMGNPPPPPYQLVENEYSLLDKTDFVFIDPVSTGFSRSVPGEDPKEYHNFTKDIESVGDFIYLLTSRFNRWASPKFLAGESYGTTRSAGLSGYLQKRHGLYLNGIMLISSILDFSTAYFNPGNDLPHILFLPTFTATAWFHKKLDEELQADLEKTLAEVKEFAQTEYTLAMMQGDRLPAEEKTRIIKKLARYTGLSEEYVEGTNLRINIHRFVKELRRDERLTIGRLDSRFRGYDHDTVGEHHEYDPSYTVIQGPYTAMFNDYMRRELEYKNDLPYEILTDKVRPWNYEAFQNQYVNVAETLREAMSMNPYLKVFIANGYFDLATPFFATEYTVSHMALEPDLRDNLQMAYYNAGHMMYVHKESLQKIKKELAEFLQNCR